MFTPANHSSRSKLYQPAHQTGDHLPPLPASFILATEDDDRLLISNSQTYRDHNQQFEHANHCTNYSRSGCESSPSRYSAIFLPEQGTTDGSGSGSLARRSSSIQSLVMNYDNNHTRRDLINYQPGVNVMISNDVHRLGDLIDSCSVRRVVFSTGDLQLQMEQQQQQQGLSSSKESSTSSSIIEGMLNKACRYSPEEKRERIERYKTKRSHRNFNKKIKYACRKTLADSRPRIRGRFARNDNSNNEDDKWAGDRYYEADDDKCENNEDDNWLDLFNAAWLLK